MSEILNELLKKGDLETSEFKVKLNCMKNHLTHKFRPRNAKKTENGGKLLRSDSDISVQLGRQNNFNRLAKERRSLRYKKSLTKKPPNIFDKLNEDENAIQNRARLDLHAEVRLMHVELKRLNEELTNLKKFKEAVEAAQLGPNESSSKSLLEDERFLEIMKSNKGSIDIGAKKSAEFENRVDEFEKIFDNLKKKSDKKISKLNQINDKNFSLR